MIGLSDEAQAGRERYQKLKKHLREVHLYDGSTGLPMAALEAIHQNDYGWCDWKQRGLQEENKSDQ